MSEERPNRQYGEKPEKQEKEEEKHEKSWEEKWRRDPLSAAVWALILIWLGVALLADNIGLFDSLRQVNGWTLFFAGAGLILLLEVAFRLVMPEYRQPVIGNIILALVFLGIGLGSIVNWGIVWGLVIIGIGLYVLYTGLFRRRE
ncbi:MAG: hypothetical protein PVF47_13875 [Anaerolineae bacterium]|jgi:hypothetical protein